MNNHLPKPWDSYYRKARVLLLVLYLAAAGFFAFLVLFPAQDFTFDFHNALASKNTVLEPRTADGTAINNGRVAAGSPLFFDTSLEGSYSQARVELTLEKDAEPLVDSTMHIQKSYRAFFYPEGDRASFPFGTILRHGQDFFIVSDNGQRLPFASSEMVKKMGYDTNAFIEISDEELNLNPEGGAWTDAEHYPNGTVFRIGNTHYQIQNNTLHPFVSENAYLTRYTPEQAIQKEEAFLNTLPVSEDWIGFRSGTRVAFADGVFLINGRSVSPIGSAPIFEALGFVWEDNLSASEEEMGIYDRGKIVLDGTPHPDGTVFFDRDTGKHFLVENKERHEVVGAGLLRILLGRQHAITVSSKALETKANCTLNKAWLFPSYSCSLPLETLASFPGNSFRFQANLRPDTDISGIDTTFETTVDWSTLHTSLAQIKQRILSRYGYEQ